MLQSAASAAEDAGPALLSDVTGRIEHVFFALPSYDPTQTDLLLSCFRGILQTLEPGVRVTLLRRPALAALADPQLSALAQLDTIDWEDGFVLRVRDAKASIHGSTLRLSRLALPDFTTWVQDPLLIARDGAEQRIWASPVVKREYGGWDDELPHRLSRHLSWPVEQLPAGLEAGNVLVNDRHVVVGSDVPRERSAGWPPLRARLASGGREVVAIAAEHPQPVFHLDLFATLAGRDEHGVPIALVGSVERACAIAAQPFEGELIKVEEKLNAVVAAFAAAGYRVERVPLVPIEVEHLPEGSWVSYNNCLVQIWKEPTGQERRVVVMPGFAGAEPDFAGLDADAIRVWSSLGFEVRCAEGAFARMAEFGGSLRCMTKVLQRSA